MDGSIVDQDFMLLDSPDAILSYRRSYQGIRFSGQADFRADTKTRAAKINYYLKPSKSEEDKDSENKDINSTSKKKKKRNKTRKLTAKEEREAGDKTEETEYDKPKYDDKIRFHVIDMEGDTLRSQARDAEEGYQSFYWYKDMKGVDWPSRKKRKEEKDREPSGPDVVAGKYKLVAIYKDKKDSTTITVRPDPRIDYDVNKEQALVKRYKAFAYTISEAKEAMDKIHKAQKTINAVNTITYALPDSTAKKIEELNKETEKSIEELVELYVMPEGLKGIQRDPTKLNSRLGTASWYLGSRWSEVGGNTDNLLKTTAIAAEEVVNKVNAFFDSEWMEYKAEIEKLDWDLF